jgi:spore coat protein U-like protein
MLATREFKRLAIAAAALGGAVYPASALPAGNTVKIAVTGNIVPSCSTSSAVQVLDVGNIAKAGSAKVTFAVDCNAPFQYSVRSEKGAMRLLNAPATVLAGRFEAPYDVHVKIPLTLGGQIDDACNSRAIRFGAFGCKFSDSGHKIAVDQTAEMQISWGDAQQMLAAGQYTDQLTITVGVKP